MMPLEGIEMATASFKIILKIMKNLMENLYFWFSTAFGDQGASRWLKVSARRTRMAYDGPKLPSIWLKLA